MLLGMFLMFVLMLAAVGTMAFLIGRRLASHLKENPEAVAALANHLFVPLIGRKKTDGQATDSERGGRA